MKVAVATGLGALGLAVFYVGIRRNNAFCIQLGGTIAFIGTALLTLFLFNQIP